MRVWKYELTRIPSAPLLFLVSWLFAAMGNLPNDLNVRMCLTPLFIKRNREERGSLSLAPMTTPGCLEQAMERQFYKAYVAPLLCLPIIHSGPGGVKVSAKTFTLQVYPKREIEWWKENTRGDGGGQVALLMILECDGNAVNEEGWDKKLCFPRRDRQSWEELEEEPRLFCAFKVEQSSADHRSVGWIEFDCESGKNGMKTEQLPLFSSPLPPSPRETVAALWRRSER